MPFKTNVLASCCCVVLFLLLSSSLLAQKTVTGRVISNADKQPIVGATVQVKGTKVATQTGADGTFSITSSKEIGTLIITVVGFEALQIPVSGRPTVGDVVLSLSATSLNDVVVTGYTAQRKKDITGAVSVVNVNEMKAVPLGSPDQMLQGQAAGVTVIGSGSPGSQANIFIRGISSFGNTYPLIIVDGVQASMHDLNPNDIESVQVLKDAGAAAIYGVRGSNGVIVITTKKGRAGKATITYDGYIGSQQPLSGNVWHTLNSKELADAYWTASINAGQVDSATGFPVSVQYGKGAAPVLPDYISPAGKFEGDPAVDPSLYNIDYSKGNIYQITKANKSGTDWFHAVFKPALIQSHTVSASGGSDKSNYLFSIGYFDQQGTLDATYLKRYSVRMNTTFNVKNNVRIGENAYLFYKDNPSVDGNSGNVNEGVIAETYRQQPIIPLYDIKGNYAGSTGGELGNSHSPFADQERSKDNKGYSWDMVGNVWAEVDFLKHFTIRTQFGGVMDNGYYYYYGYHTYENSENNSSNSFSENAYYNTQWTWTNTLQYNNVFAEKHALKVIGGIETVYDYGRGVTGNRLTYFTDDPNYRTLSAGAALGSPANSSYAYNDVLYSLFARADYAYMDKYLLSATIRQDQYSGFGPDKRTGVFPSVSLGWRISQEEFMKNVTWVNDLKLRASYGTLGSKQNVNRYNQYTLFTSNPGVSFYSISGSTSNTAQGFSPAQIGSPSTGWEEDQITNIGLDASILHNKLDFSVEWYKKKISGLLFQDQATAIALGGASAPAVNIGDVQNTGVDFSAVYHANISRDFKLNIGANITTYKSEVISIPGTGGYFTAGGSRITDLVRNQAGHPVSSFYGYKIIGYFASADDVSKSPTQADAKAGRFKYADINHDNKIDDNDRTFIGNPNPDFTYGININATYKDFDFTMILYGSHGNDILNYVRYWTDFWASFQGNKSQNLAHDSWTPNNLNPKAPILENASTFSTNTVPNSFYEEKGSFLKCRSLIIGYTLPAATLKNIGLNKLRIYVQAANLFTITKYTGLDPEVQGASTTDANGGGITNSAAYGIDYGNYPGNQKTYIVGVSLNF
jgi:TonB-linked SusC/RagA family outer membrane protein